MKFTLKKKIVAGGVAAALALGGGIAAYAFFTAGGAGTGTGSTASAANTTLNVAFPVVNLGATVTATTASITNPSTTGSVSVTGQTLTLVSADCTIGAGTPVTATTGWFTLGEQPLRPHPLRPVPGQLPGTGDPDTQQRPRRQPGRLPGSDGRASPDPGSVVRIRWGAGFGSAPYRRSGNEDCDERQDHHMILSR